MQAPDDRELLREFARSGSEAAFEAIVSRHVNLVHSAAVRQVRDPALAAEVTQTVFLVLAKKARSLPKKTILSGWLYRTAQFAGSRALRAEWRRKKNEQEAAQMQPEMPDPHWEHMEPHLEEAMAGLRNGDRDAVVLRYFENKDLKTVGTTLGTTEEGARKRVTRAVEKLRAFFQKRGVKLSAVGIAGVLSANAVQAAPAAVAAKITTAVTATGALTVSNTLLIEATLKFMAWTKIKTAVVAATVVLVTAGTATITVREIQRPGNHSKLSVMPDGSFIRLLGVTAGTSFQYRAKTPTALERKLVKYLPSKLASAYDGWLGTGNSSMTMGAPPGVTNLNLGVLVARERPSGPNARRPGGVTWVRAVLIDEEGNQFEGSTGGGTIGNDDGKHYKSIEYWVMAAYPRRSKTVRVCFMDELNGTNRVVADFRVANPLAANYPVWTAQAIPNTQTDGDLSVTLTSLTSGKVNAPAELGGPDKPATRATFRYEQNGVETKAWHPQAIVISDATGNHWSPYARQFSAKTPTELFFQDALWAGEQAFKLRLELARSNNFAPTELCTLRGIKVPGATETNTPSISANVLGAQLTVIAFTGSSAEQPGNLKWNLRNGQPRISMRVTPMPDDARLTLLKVTDDRGREVPFEGNAEYGLYHSNEKVFALKLAADAKTVDCAFAVSKSRFVEFLAKPEIEPAKK